MEFLSGLKRKATGVMLMQAVDENYVPVTGPISIPWIEVNGSIVIYPIPGLAANKTYNLRLLVT